MKIGKVEKRNRKGKRMWGRRVVEKRMGKRKEWRREGRKRGDILHFLVVTRVRKEWKEKSGKKGGSILHFLVVTST